MKIRSILLALYCCFYQASQAQLFFEKVLGEPIQVDQFREPLDVAIDPSGNIFVVDGNSNLVKKLDPAGNPITQWGAGGGGNGQFNFVRSVKTDASGNVYVIDLFGNYIQKFSNSGGFSNKWGSYGSADGLMYWPQGIAIDAAGNMYVADTQNHRIQKFNSNGGFVAKWGTRGSTDGQFEYPQGIALDANGNIYVVDTNNHRVQKLNSSGQFQAKWGSFGNADGQFSYPQGIAIDGSGNIYVSDAYNHRIQKFNILGNFVAKTGTYGAGNGQFNVPLGLDIDATGNVYATDYNNKRIQKFSNSLVFLTSFGKPNTNGQLNLPVGLAMDGSGNVYVADTRNHQIQKFNSAGNFVTRWGSFGTGNNQFYNPTGVAVDASGNVYVVDSANERVLKFNNTGTYITQWGGGGNGDGQFRDPKGIAIDVNNNIYIIERGNHRVQKFSSTGTFITKWGALGIGDGDFQNPQCIAVDADGNVYVGDTDNHRVQKFTGTGTFITKWGKLGTENGNFSSPFGISVSTNGNVYVVDDNHRVQKFTSSGSFVFKYGTYGWADGTLRHPRGIVADSNGNVYLTDSNSRIQKFAALDILSLSANSGTVNSSFTISGSGFSTVPSENVVKINSTVCTVTATGPSSLTVTVPAGATTGKVSVTRGGFTVQSTDEFLVLPLAITSFTPAVGSFGASITISGTGFSSVKENNTVKFNGVAATVTGSTSTSITATVPAGNTVGKISVTVNGITATSTNNFEGTLAINSFTPASGLAGSPVTLSGTGFSSTAASQVVKFNGITATVTSSSLNSLTVTVPTGATTGKISIAREGSTVLSTSEFLVLPLAVTSFTPGAGIVGTQLTINGTGFSSVNSNNSVAFNGVTTTVTNSSSTSITTAVPIGATTGKISITVAGQTATSTSDFTITKLGISQTSYPEFFIVDESGANVAILVNDINEIQSIKINRRGITEEDSKLKVDAIPFTTSGNTVSLSVPASYFTDPLGLYCWFSVTEKAGNEILSQPGNIYLKYLASSNKQVIPDLKSGRSGGAYQLIAIPLELPTKSTKDVFSDLGSYNNKKWRLFSLTNEKLSENPSTIETGKGYWFIMRDPTEINPGQGTVVKATKQTPYKINLSPEWNLIGNPYNFSISWDDVLDQSGLPETKLKFRQFINGSMNNEPILTRYRGGFVWSDVAREIEIPVINKSAAGGRKAITQTQPIDKPEWMVNLTLQDDEFSNSLFGFGMNPQASVEKDLWDETALPLLEGLSPFEMSFAKHLVKDVVTTMENYSWQAQLSASKNILLRWDNSYFGNNEKQLIIENSNEVETINMRSANQLKLLEGNHLLKFHYGNADYIKDQLMESSARIGNVFPNPIKKSDGTISVAVSLPEGDNEVSLRLKNLLGQDINYSGPGHYEGGRRTIQWQSDFNQLPSGMYLMQIEVKDAKGVTSRIIRRIIFE